MSTGETITEERDTVTDSFVDDNVSYDDDVTLTETATKTTEDSSEKPEAPGVALGAGLGLGAGPGGRGGEAKKEKLTATSNVPIEDLVNFAGADRDTNERRQAAFSFAHFSTEEESQFAIVKMRRNYGIHAILGLLNSGDHICQRYAALCLGNIAAHPELRRDLVASKVLDHLIPLAINGDIDLDTQRYSILAVANLASDTDTHKVRQETRKTTALTSQCFFLNRL